MYIMIIITILILSNFIKPMVLILILGVDKWCNENKFIKNYWVMEYNLLKIIKLLSGPRLN